MKPLRVLLVDDEIMIREGFKRLFDWPAHDCQVVGEAADGMQALSQIDALQPDIVIMDINIPIMNGLKVIQLSRIKHPDTAFVIVSGYDDFAYCRKALRLQITDYALFANNLPSAGGTGTAATNPTGTEAWQLQSYLTYQVSGRDYVKSRTVLRAR